MALHALALLLVWALAPPTIAFMDRSNGIHLFNLPELKTSKHRQLSANGHAGQGHRMLLRNEKGEFPEVHDSGSYVGITDMGFVDFDHVRYPHLPPHERAPSETLISFLSLMLHYYWPAGLHHASIHNY